MHVLVVGLAREGMTLAKYLQAQGAEVTVTDHTDSVTLRQQIERLDAPDLRSVLGGDHPELLDGADVVCVSPGVPESNPIFIEARKRNMQIESMTTLFFERCPGPIVGITGSSGKTTTTGLLGHMARTSGMDVVVGGNIGDPMIELLSEIGPTTTVILELSSFQLSLLRTSPHLAIVTNISPNHLDRHGTMEAYIDAKLHVVSHQTENDYAVLNRCDSQRETFAQSTPGDVRWFGPDSESGASVRGDSVCLVDGTTAMPVVSVKEIPLLGQHNVENVLAAVTAAAVLGITPGVMAAAIRTFQSAAHRLETVGSVEGVSYVDDSIATTPARARVALEAIGTGIVLIAGGRDKRLPWDEFAQAVAQRVRVLLLIGEAAAQIEEAVLRALESTPRPLVPSHIRHCDSLQAAVVEANRVARRGETVLLSPACTSYDMFSNFEERGRVFAHEVEKLNAA